MLGWLRWYFGSPPGEVEGSTVRARLLSGVLNLHLLVALAIAILYPKETESQRTLSAAAIATIPIALAVRVLLHRGVVRVASWVFLVTLSLVIPGLSLYLTGSLALVSVAIFQMMLIVMAGMLLGGRESVGFAAAIVTVNAVFFWREALSLPEQARGIESTWILQAIVFVATGALLARAISLVEEAFGMAARETGERKAAETALRRSEERYRLITKVSSDYTFSTEITEDGGLRLNWVAGAFEAITGFTFDDYVARGGWRAALHPDDVAQDARDLEALRQNRPVASELRTLCADGTVRWVRIYAHPVWDEEKQRLSGIFGAVQDISARKAAEAEREALIHELEARNAELERFTYTVSHDLKSPLITIRGFLGHIEQAALQGNLEAVRSDMERVYRSTAKMHQLLDDLLDLSRVGRQAKPPERVPFEAIVRDALDRTHGRLSAQNVKVVVQEGLPSVNVDRDRIVEVMQNLIDNAAKFMGGQSEPRIWIGAKAGAFGRVFFVRDNGVGIEPHHRERIFNLFDKLDPKSAGTGVGLALVKRIIEVHGGRIWVEPDPGGEGTVFLFTLGDPATVQASPAPSPEAERTGTP